MISGCQALMLFIAVFMVGIPLGVLWVFSNKTSRGMRNPPPPAGIKRPPPPPSPPKKLYW
jgi:hypothetical protein